MFFTMLSSRYSAGSLWAGALCGTHTPLYLPAHAVTLLLYEVYVPHHAQSQLCIYPPPPPPTRTQHLTDICSLCGRKQAGKKGGRTELILASTAAAIAAAAALFSLAIMVRVLMMGLELKVNPRSSCTYWLTRSADVIRQACLQMESTGLSSDLEVQGCMRGFFVGMIAYSIWGGSGG